MERYLRVPSVGKGLKRDLTNSFLLWGFAGSVWGAGSNGSSLLFPVVLLSEKKFQKITKLYLGRILFRYKFLRVNVAGIFKAFQIELYNM